MPLIDNVLNPSAKSVLMPLGLIFELSLVDASIQKKKKKIRSGMTTLIFSNEELNNIIKTVNSVNGWC